MWPRSAHDFTARRGIISGKMKVFICSILCLASAASAANLVELAKSLGANTLVELVTEAGLASTLASGGIFILFKTF